MLHSAFRMALVLSVSGSLITVLLFLLRPVTQKVFNQTWRYRMCVLAVFFYLLPVGMAGNSLYNALPHQSAQLPDRPHAVSALLDTVAPLPTEDIVPADPSAQNFTQTTETEKRTGISLSDVLPFLPYIWLIGAVLFACINGFRYVRFRRRLIRTGLPVEDGMIYSLLEAGKTAQGVSGKIRLLTSDAIRTPMLTGIFRTLLILPEVEANGRELSTIFRHELIHYQRRDLWIKTVLLFVETIYWFNPVVYLLAKETEASCELSCDEQVVRDMSMEDRCFYGETILNMLARVAEKQTGVYTTLAETKRGIKKRLALMLSFKKMSKKTAVFSVIAAMLCILAGCSVAAAVSGAAGNISGHPPSPSLPIPVSAHGTDEPSTTAGHISRRLAGGLYAELDTSNLRAPNHADIILARKGIPDREALKKLLDGRGKIIDDQKNGDNESYQTEDVSIMAISDITYFFRTKKYDFISAVFKNDPAAGRFYNADMYPVNADLPFMPYKRAVSEVVSFLYNAGITVCEPGTVYSLNHDTMRKQEAILKDNGGLTDLRDGSVTLKDSWDESDDCYYMRLSGSVASLPVSDVTHGFASDTGNGGIGTLVEGCIIEAAISADGIEYLSILYPYQEVEPVEKDLKLLSVDEGLNFVAQKYEKEQVNGTATITDARFCYIPIHKDALQTEFLMVPGWYFGATQTSLYPNGAPASFSRYLLVSAVTGEVFEGNGGLSTVSGN